MGSVNKWIGIGNLGADVELKYTPSSKAVCNLSIACSEVWKDKAGQKQERVEWVKVQVWGDQAENHEALVAFLKSDPPPLAPYSEVTVWKRRFYVMCMIAAVEGLLLTFQRC